MFITSQKEIYSIMPTAKWSRPERLYGWIQEEEETALVPLLGLPLYSQLLGDYKRLVTKYEDITAMHIRPDGTLINDDTDGYITPRTDDIGDGETTDDSSDGDDVVGSDDMAIIGLIRICQQIEFYEMLGHKMGLLATSFNESGVNRASANNYDSAEDKDVERAAKDAFMSAKRSTDALLLTLERDAHGERRFTSKWKEAEYYYRRSDLLFTTASTMQEYYNLGGSREKYITLLKDIRFCQNIYLRPRLGAQFLQTILEFIQGKEENENEETAIDEGVMKETVNLLRQALALYVEARQNAKTRNVMSAIMTDAEQALSTAIEFIRENQEAYKSAIQTSPLYQPAEETAPATVERDPERLDKARGRRQVGDCSESAIFTFPIDNIVEPR